jgi:hypothetical protein
MCAELASLEMMAHNDNRAPGLATSGSNWKHRSNNENRITKSSSGLAGARSETPKEGPNSDFDLKKEVSVPVR